MPNIIDLMDEETFIKLMTGQTEDIINLTEEVEK